MLEGLSLAGLLSPLEAARAFAHELPDDACVAVAISGGSDSLGLLVALKEALSLKARGLSLKAITVDHALRPGSADEARRVAEICRDLDVDHLTIVWRGEKPSSGIMAAAREARYRLLIEGAARLGAGLIVTAHTLDDQRETVAMRRARSSAPDARGLAGISEAALFFADTWVYRPFLGVMRRDIRSFLQDRGFHWIDDPSNEDRRFERVRLRQSGVASAPLADLGTLAASRSIHAAQAAALILQQVTMPIPLLFAIEAERDEDDAFRLALAALVAVAGGQTHLPSRRHLAEALERLGPAPRAHAVSLGRTILERRGGRLYVGREARGLPEIVLEPKAAGFWDGRFRLSNRGDRAVAVRAGKAYEPQAGIPPRIGRRAWSVLPAAEGEAGIVGTPFLAPFERVLPIADLPLADAIATIAGRSTFPQALAGFHRTREELAAVGRDVDMPPL